MRRDVTKREGRDSAPPHLSELNEAARQGSGMRALWKLKGAQLERYNQRHETQRAPKGIIRLQTSMRKPKGFRRNEFLPQYMQVR